DFATSRDDAEQCSGDDSTNNANSGSNERQQYDYSSVPELWTESERESADYGGRHNLAPGNYHEPAAGLCSRRERRALGRIAVGDDSGARTGWRDGRHWRNFGGSRHTEYSPGSGIRRSAADRHALQEHEYDQKYR